MNDARYVITLVHGMGEEVNLDPTEFYAGESFAGATRAGHRDFSAHMARPQFAYRTVCRH
jgi:hypothetical protein